MEYSGAISYVNAKAQGIFSKSFVGKKASLLFSAKTIPELWTLVFNTEVPLIPQTLLVEKLEEEAEDKFLSQYISLIEMFDKPPKIIIDLLNFYVIRNLKTISSSLCIKDTKMPHIANLGKYGVLHYDKWPDIAKITQGTQFEWYNEVPNIHEQHIINAKLDNQYVRIIWQSVNKIHGEDKLPIIDFFKRYFVMTNIIWTLRLKVYYNMEYDEIIKHLAYAYQDKSDKDPFASPAIDIINKDISNYSDWENWSYSRFVNPNEEGIVWQIDPRWVEDSYMASMFRDSEKFFHKYPLSNMPLVALFRIKQHECNIIRTAAESIRLNITANEAMEIAGVIKDESKGI